MAAQSAKCMRLRDPEAASSRESTILERPSIALVAAGAFVFFAVLRVKPFLNTAEPAQQLFTEHMTTVDLESHACVRTRCPDGQQRFLLITYGRHPRRR